MAFLADVETHLFFPLRLQHLHLLEVLVAAVGAANARVRPDRVAAVTDEEARAALLLLAQDSQDRWPAADRTVIALPADLFPDGCILGLCRHERIDDGPAEEAQACLMESARFCESMDARIRLLKKQRKEGSCLLRCIFKCAHRGERLAQSIRHRQLLAREQLGDGAAE